MPASIATALSALSPARLRPALAAAVVALGLVAAGEARAEPANFVGGGVLYGFSDGCGDFWQERTHGFAVRLHTPDVTSDTSPMTLSFFGREYAMSYRLESGRFDSSFQPVRAMILFGTFDGHRARIRMLSQQPPVLTPDTTAPVRMRGVIRDPFGTGNCTARFDATVGRGPAL